MRLAIISDLHINLDGEDSFGIDTQENARTILKELVKRDPDHLVILGDICLKKPSDRTYAWLKTQLTRLGIRYTLIAGNHDDVSMMQSEFDLTLTEGRLYGKVVLEEHSFLYLDSSSKSIDEGQLSWMAEEIKSSEQPLLHVFMHHPPTDMDIPYMDEKHSLENQDQVMSVLQESKVPMTVYCGHYHVEKEVQQGLVRIMVNPSCYFQLDHSTYDFRIDHYNIAYRILDLKKESARTSLHYLTGHKIS